jgi:two-component system, NarL family, nitrate/nitrite response regulator NarL
MALIGLDDERTPAAPAHEAQVATIVVSENSMFCMGLRQVLSGTRFLVSEAVLSNDSLSPCPPGAGPMLVIVAATHHSDPAKAVRLVKAQCPEARVVVMADRADPGLLLAGVQAGADGFCLMTVDADILIKTLELVAAGGSIFPAAIVRPLIERISAGREYQPNEAPSSETKDTFKFKAHRLSVREGEILRCLMDGASNKIIARQVGVTEATVKVHVKAILRKTGLKNRTQAALWAASRVSSQLGIGQNSSDY